ncbi:Late embryogenesis abundant protein [Musa troglodytarum]|uniref:Late embryogenesis abundant protein n=1 Tax=Musa troglodytarum TaxID=320322 RepID=A0A9E7K1W1_9LILI|nr:Late embryogenesis abundant protein [Musa troglodytarum]
MSRVPMNAFLLLSRRSHATVAAVVSRVPAAEGESRAATREGVFWMRDPKTGNWMPENRFGDVDVAELRARFLEGMNKNALKD